MMADKTADENSPEQELGRWQAVKQAGGAVAHIIRETWAVSPVLMVSTALLSLGLAAIPGLEVVAIGALARAIQTGERVVLFVSVLALLVAFDQIAGNLGHLVSDRMVTKQHLRQQSRLLDAITRISPQTLATKTVNAEIQACRGGLRDVAYYFSSVMSAARTVLAAVGVCVAVWRIDVAAGWLILLALLPLLLSSSYLAKYQDKAWDKLGEQMRHVDYSVEQLVFQRTGTELVTLGSGHHMADKATRHRERFNRLMISLIDRIMFANVAAALVTAFLLAGALWALAHSGAGTAGIAAGIMGVLGGMGATQSAGYALGFLVSDAPKVNRFRRFIGSAPDSERQVVVPAVGELVAQGISVTYPGKSEPSLVDASITARRGEMVALVGINGAGKTTMVNAILGIVDAQQGSVTIDGVDADTMTPQQRLSHFGLLTQEFGRYELTVREAVMLGTPETDVPDERLWAALAAARIDDVVRAMPDGLDAQLGQQWDGVGLSGGQWQRIALARIYLRGAGIWVLDEPTSAIDAEAEQQIFSELNRGKAERITIVVSHRAWTLRAMDRIHVFQDGRIVETGTYPELLAAKGRFSEIFAQQA